MLQVASYPDRVVGAWPSRSADVPAYVPGVRSFPKGAYSFKQGLLEHVVKGQWVISPDQPSKADVRELYTHLTIAYPLRVYFWLNEHLPTP